MNDPILTRAVQKYYTEKAKIKERQKVELAREVYELAADVGDEIARVRREQGASIADVAAIIGVQNRSFIYTMIKASEERALHAPKVKNKGEIPDEADDEDEDDESPTFLIEWFNEGTTAVVTFPEDDERYEVPIIDGVPDLPEEWADHTKERRELYKVIVKLLRNNNNNN